MKKPKHLPGMEPSVHEKNQLYYGDNLDIMKNFIADASVDLIYLDPPFNSQRNYNLIYQKLTGQCDWWLYLLATADKGDAGGGCGGWHV